MSDNANKGLCPSCTNSIFCETWAEMKCKALDRRIYGYKTMTSCKFYKKRDKNFKESACQCEDCLSNSALHEEYLEEE